MALKDISMWTLLVVAVGLYMGYRIYTGEKLAKQVISQTQASSVTSSAAATSELFGGEIFNIY